MADGKQIVGRTKHGESTLDQIAELQPEDRRTQHISN